MKKIVCIMIALSFLAGCSSDPQLSQPTTNVSEEITSLGRKQTGTVQAEATVTDIDYEDRLLTIKNYQGQESTLKIGPEVRNFAQIDKGDTVKVNYEQSVSYELRDPTPEEIAAPSQMVVDTARARLGDKPAATRGASVKSVVTIESVNPVEKGVLSVRGPQGNVVTIIAKYPERLKTVRPGDTAVVTYSEAIAIGVESVD